MMSNGHDAKRWHGSSRVPGSRTMPRPDEYREAIVQRWGRRALVSLALRLPLRETATPARASSLPARRCMFDHGRVPALVPPELRNSEGPDVAVRTA
jgi:hypothetical protein